MTDRGASEKLILTLHTGQLTGQLTGISSEAQKHVDPSSHCQSMVPPPNVPPMVSERGSCECLDRELLDTDQVRCLRLINLINHSELKHRGGSSGGYYLCDKMPSIGHVLPNWYGPIIKKSLYLEIPRCRSGFERTPVSRPEFWLKKCRCGSCSLENPTGR